MNGPNYADCVSTADWLIIVTDIIFLVERKYPVFFLWVSVHVLSRVCNIPPTTSNTGVQ